MCPAVDFQNVSTAGRRSRARSRAGARTRRATSRTVRPGLLGGARGQRQKRRLTGCTASSRKSAASSSNQGRSKPRRSRSGRSGSRTCSTRAASRSTSWTTSPDRKDEPSASSCRREWMPPPSSRTASSLRGKSRSWPAQFVARTSWSRRVLTAGRDDGTESIHEHAPEYLENHRRRFGTDGNESLVKAVFGFYRLILNGEADGRDDVRVTLRALARNAPRTLSSPARPPRA